MIHIPQWTKIAENQTAAKSQFFWLQVASCEFRTARKKIITVLRFLGGKFKLQIFSKDGPAIFRFVESVWVPDNNGCEDFYGMESFFGTLRHLLSRLEKFLGGLIKTNILRPESSDRLNLFYS